VSLISAVPVPVPVPVPGDAGNKALRVADGRYMQALDHERLDVYHLALDFLVFANSAIEALPRGRSHLADQFTRASMSVVLNIAEGAGKVSKADKRRYYLTARGSATESAALLDACLRLKLLDEAPHATGKEMVVRIVSMLIRLAQACEQ
jgi:four helix bundle protein